MTGNQSNKYSIKPYINQYRKPLKKSRRLNINVFKTIVTMLLVVMLTSMSVVVSYADESDLVVLEVDQTSIQMNATTTLTLTIDASIDVKEIGIEGLDLFNVESNSQGSSTQIINGKKTSTFQYKLVISPKSIGEFKLKTIVKDDKTSYESKEIVVTVKERDTSLDSETEDVFIKTIISSDAYYFGENIVLTYELYSRYNLDDFGFLDTINYDGFVVDETPKDELESTIVTINDSKYLKQVVKKDVLVPIKVGEFEIPSYRFQANLSTGDFFSRSEPRYLQTDPISFKVNELPKDNKPLDFTGIVGKLDIKSSFDKTSVELGEAISLQVLLTSTGNLNVVGSLYDQKQDGFSIYETEKFSDKNIVDNEYIETKSYEIIIVPEKAGELVLENLSLNYFDTELNDYKEVSIPSQTIMVTGTTSGSIVDMNENNNSIITEPILISQVSYEEDQKDVWVIEINKKWSIILILILFSVIVMTVIIVRRKNKPKVGSYQAFITAAKKAESIEDLYGVLEQFVVEEIQLQLKSSQRKNITTHPKFSKIAEPLDQLILKFEQHQINQVQDLNELKTLMIAMFKQM